MGELTNLQIYQKEYREKNKEKITQYHKERNLAKKLRVLHIYGNTICKCCGEDEPTFLSIDHIDNDGALDRKEKMGSSRAGGYHFYNWLIDNNFPTPHKYQVLCMNCQFGKYQNNGICPHQK